VTVITPHRDKDILPNLGDPTQLDCIDEAVNTWTYLTLMERSGLLHFHRVAKLPHAGSLIDPRNTAVLQEIGGQYFAKPCPPYVPCSWTASFVESGKRSLHLPTPCVRGWQKGGPARRRKNNARERG
jgi:hypothetical protein